MELVNATVDFLNWFPCDVSRIHLDSSRVAFVAVAGFVVRWILK